MSQLLVEDSRVHLELPDGNAITLSFDDEGELVIAIDNPSAGDTETGVGANTSIQISKADAVPLISWLVAHLPRTQ
jgi:hypothetical protein